MKNWTREVKQIYEKLINNISWALHIYSFYTHIHTPDTQIDKSVIKFLVYNLFKTIIMTE